MAGRDPPLRDPRAPRLTSSDVRFGYPAPWAVLVALAVAIGYGFRGPTGALVALGGALALGIAWSVWRSRRSR
jgi:hypothetical protein